MTSVCLACLYTKQKVLKIIVTHSVCVSARVKKGRRERKRQTLTVGRDCICDKVLRNNTVCAMYLHFVEI